VNAVAPQQLSFGASVQPVDGVTLNAELTWVDWSDYQTSIGAADVVLTLDVPPELMDFIEVPDSINSTRPIQPGFTDRWVPRVGAEIRAIDTGALELDVRCGYFYESTPIPNQSGPYNLVDTDRHAFSLGAGLRLTDLEPTVRGFLAIDIHFQYSILPERVIVKQSLVDTFGDYRAHGHIFAAGMTTEVGFE
jgi:long-chain fatty acid transport protein